MMAYDRAPCRLGVTLARRVILAAVDVPSDQRAGDAEMPAGPPAGPPAVDPTESVPAHGSTGRARLADRGWDEPHPQRLRRDDPNRSDILAAHATAVNASQPGYLDPRTGLFVLTSVFLANRGTCCGRGCRHCPYVV